MKDDPHLNFPVQMEDSKNGGEYVLKRNGEKEMINPQKILRRLQKLKNDVEVFLERKLNVSVWRIAQAVIGQIYDGITTSELDEEAAEISAYITDHPDYSDFAGQILVSNLEANNRDSMNFLAYAEKAYNFVEEKTGAVNHLISDELLAIARKFSHIIDRKLTLNRNYLYDYFAFQTLSKGKYLLHEYKIIQKNKMKQKRMVPFESPQHMWMRVALGIHGWNLDAAFELYDFMSLKKCTMATPTLFNSGTPHPQNSSCFLVQMKDDSIEGIYDTLKQTALISQQAGGIGLSVHNIRATGSYIRGTNGTSNGLVPMLRVFNNTAKYVDQGGGKRKGSFAIYLEPWHADIFEFLDLKKPHGAEDERARDLFFGLWIPDLFWERVTLAYSRSEEDEKKNPVLWSLMCPATCPGLSDVHGEKFTQLYTRYESEKKYNRQVPIKALMTAILTAQIETGVPYMLNKDHCNRKSNQQNLGTIKSSNLCCEIVEYTSPDQVSVCNLSSISLPAFVDPQTKTFDYKGLYQVTRVLTRATNRVIDINQYPIKEAKNSNLRNRPIGIGVQGLADVFLKMRLRFGCAQSKEVNRNIFETIYFAALEESHALTQVIDTQTNQKVGPYPSIDDNGGAPIRHGIFQFDMWQQDYEKTKNPDGWKPNPALGWDWETLRNKVKQDGVRNSLLVAPMPTASTSQILGNTESFEPYFGMMFTRKTKSGLFILYCRYLIEELIARGLWTVETHPVTQKPYIPLKEKIMMHMGSIQNIAEIPEDIKELYVGVFDVKTKDLTDMACDRSVFIDQSSSLNIYFKNEDNMMTKLLAYHTYAWKIGLKTGSYYVRTQQKLESLDFTGLKSTEPECVSCSA